MDMLGTQVHDTRFARDSAGQWSSVSNPMPNADGHFMVLMAPPTPEKKVKLEPASPALIDDNDDDDFLSPPKGANGEQQPIKVEGEVANGASNGAADGSGGASPAALPASHGRRRKTSRAMEKELKRTLEGGSGASADACVPAGLQNSSFYEEALAKQEKTTSSDRHLRAKKKTVYHCRKCGVVVEASGSMCDACVLSSRRAAHNKKVRVSAKAAAVYVPEPVDMSNVVRPKACKGGRCCRDVADGEGCGRCCTETRWLCMYRERPPWWWSACCRSPRAPRVAL